MNQSLNAVCKVVCVISGIAGAAAAIAFICERIEEWKKRSYKGMHRPFGIYEHYLKRPLDCFLAAGALAVLSPVFLILAAVGAVAMKGNPFFMQERPGKDEKIFKLIKFRTMTNEKDPETGQLLPDEQRLGRYGKFLRASSADELGELLNIIKGDMAIVGPRPLLVRYLERYNAEQHRRHEVRPGLTGLAQVNGRNTISWEEKFGYDVAYVDHVTFKDDADIILKTVRSVLKHEGISSETCATMEEFRG